MVKCVVDCVAGRSPGDVIGYLSVMMKLKLQLHSPIVCGDCRPNMGRSIDCWLNLNLSSLTTQQSTQNAQWLVDFQPWHWLGIQAAIESLFISMAGLGHLEGDCALWHQKLTIKLGHLSGSFPLEVSHISSTGSGTHKFTQNLLTDLILGRKKSSWIPHKVLESIARLRDIWMLLLHFFFYNLTLDVHKTTKMMDGWMATA